MALFTNEKKLIKEDLPSTGTITIVGAGTEINGDINCKADIRIDGTVNGNLICQAKIILGISGVINGNTIAINADISGKISGSLTVQELTILKTNSIITGDTETNKLVIENGAVINGAIKMSPQRPTLNNNKATKEVAVEI